MKSTKTPEALRPYEFHGLEFSLNGTQATATCPFCSKAGKFFISQKTGKYHCKVCDAKGNKYTYLTHVHEALVDSTTNTDYNWIKNQRGGIFSTQFLKDHGICVTDSNEIAVPVRTPGKPNLVNLKRWSPETKILYNTPTCSSVFVAHWLDNGPVFICEGEWDALALLLLFIKAKVPPPCIIAAPGATSFKQEWVERYANRDIYILFDWDPPKEQNGKSFSPGKDGADRLEKMFSEYNQAKGNKVVIKRVDWLLYDKDIENEGVKFDTRDYVTEAVKTKKSKLFLDRLLGTLLVTSDNSTKVKAPSIKRESFSEVCEDFKKVYKWSQSFSDSLLCAFASIVSLKIPGDPLWFFLVAPPSSGKTILIETFSEAEDFTFHLSRVKDTALVSGWRGDGDDPSLLPKLRDKSLFIKDFTAVLSLSMSDKDRLYGILRDAYDGEFTQTYGTGLYRSYKDLYFGIFAGVTHAIHGENQTALGERFLKINLVDDNYDQDELISVALGTKLATKSNNKKGLKESVNAFLLHLSTQTELPEFPEKYVDRLKGIAKFIAITRTSVARGFSRDIMYRPEIEGGSRVAVQLKKLAIAAAMILGKPEVDDECFRIVTKVALDTCTGWKLDLIEALSKSKNGMSTYQIAEAMKVHPNQVRRIVEDAVQLEILKFSRKSNGSGKRGNKVYCYQIADQLQNFIRAGGITFKGMTKTPSNKTKDKKRRYVKR